MSGTRAQQALRDLDARLREAFGLPITAEEAYDSFYQDMVAEALAAAEPQPVPSSPMADRIVDLEMAAIACGRAPTEATAQALEQARHNLYTAVVGHIQQQLGEAHKRAPSDLVLLANGRAVDLGGRWTRTV